MSKSHATRSEHVHSGTDKSQVENQKHQRPARSLRSKQFGGSPSSIRPHRRDSHSLSEVHGSPTPSRSPQIPSKQVKSIVPTSARLATPGGRSASTHALVVGRTQHVARAEEVLVDALELAHGAFFQVAFEGFCSSVGLAALHVGSEPLELCGSAPRRRRSVHRTLRGVPRSSHRWRRRCLRHSSGPVGPHRVAGLRSNVRLPHTRSRTCTSSTGREGLPCFQVASRGPVVGGILVASHRRQNCRTSQNRRKLRERPAIDRCRESCRRRRPLSLHRVLNHARATQSNPPTESQPQAKYAAARLHRW